MITKARLLLQAYGSLDKIVALVKVNDSSMPIVGELRTADESKILAVAQEDIVNATTTNLLVVARFPRSANSRYPTGKYKVWVSQTGDDIVKFDILFDAGKPRVKYPDAP